MAIVGPPTYPAPMQAICISHLLSPASHFNQFQVIKPGPWENQTRTADRKPSSKGLTPRMSIRSFAVQHCTGKSSLGDVGFYRKPDQRFASASSSSNMHRSNVLEDRNSVRAICQEGETLLDYAVERVRAHDDLINSHLMIGRITQ